MHTPVDGLAHVVDGEQGHLHGGEGFIQINNLQHTAFNRLTQSCVFSWTKFGQDFLPDASLRYAQSLSRPRLMPVLG